MSEPNEDLQGHTITEAHQSIQKAMVDARLTPEYAEEGRELAMAETKDPLADLKSQIAVIVHPVIDDHDPMMQEIYEVVESAFKRGLQKSLHKGIAKFMAEDHSDPPPKP